MLVGSSRYTILRSDDRSGKWNFCMCSLDPAIFVGARKPPLLPRVFERVVASFVTRAAKFLRHALGPCGLFLCWSFFQSVDISHLSCKCGLVGEWCAGTTQPSGTLGWNGTCVC